MHVIIFNHIYANYSVSRRRKQEESLKKKRLDFNLKWRKITKTVPKTQGFMHLIK